MSDVVLIVGAGGSKPYGFPLGRELRLSIIKQLGEPTTRKYYQTDLGAAESDLMAFRENVIKAGCHETIDDFLNSKPSHRSIGAIAITHALKQREDETSLFYGPDGSTAGEHFGWYPSLYRSLRLDQAEHSLGLRGIVTLNYDRSLEHYITSSVNSGYEGSPRQRVMQKWEGVELVYLHGSLGSYPGIPYSRGYRDPGEHRAAAEDLKISTDDLTGSDPYRKARELLARCDTVVFIGFGYHEEILERLTLIKSGHTIVGSVYGIDKKDADRICSYFREPTLVQTKAERFYAQEVTPLLISD